MATRAAAACSVGMAAQAVEWTGARAAVGVKAARWEGHEGPCLAALPEASLAEALQAVREA